MQAHGGVVTETTYDSGGPPTLVENVNSSITLSRTVYDYGGRVDSTRNAEGRLTICPYDVLDQPVWAPGRPSV